MPKILVVGAGFSGAVIARELAEKSFDVHVIEKRNHIGGNAYDYINEYNIRIHKYGPHLFHTNNSRVFNWLSKYTEWIPYMHKVKAMLSDGKLVTLPINLETKKIVGNENLIDIFYRPYSEKMWNLKLEEIDTQILNRIPIRDDLNEYYFPDDKFQFTPNLGFTNLISNILNHKNIKVHLDTPFKKTMEADFKHVFNSMPIDEYYGYLYGELPYRSIRFTNISLPMPRIFPVAVINFTHFGKYTRITEWKNIPGHGFNDQFTTLTYEEPCDYKENNMERFYPVKDRDGKNKELYNLYREIINPKVTFIGRLGQYLYLNMDQVISSSLKTADIFINGQ